MSATSGPRLSPRQREILEVLALDHPHCELTREPGAGWWFGNVRTTGALGMRLLRLCAITTDNYGEGQLERYRITGTGRRLLEGGPAYQAADGALFWTLGDLQGAMMGVRPTIEPAGRS